ncbi:nicotinate phosphoribosyltransferase [Pseudaminobacter sp. 19-2017]|uniref:Nicotinamide phosphoribosyltransferase n=1 Tax=Pseudaminobacter soli (ex Zhang et al. 2022) TaxID=2831468 RepID=A0A942E5C2_9HYPH|nr:nicotinate phosphoribosyltransferase [Pseudaminobacter soli]
MNPILNTDSYKTSHFLQYPPETAFVNSYIEARPVEGYDEVVFFGLQMFIKEYLLWGPQVTANVIDEAEAFCEAHGVPFNRTGWEIIAHEYDGYLPLEIKALSEGTVVPTGTPMVQVVNTDPRLPWLTSYVETALLRAVWYPSTVATNSREIKKVIVDALMRSSDDPAGQAPFKLHDFGARGTGANEQAGIGGAAHLVNFKGTDTMMGAYFAQRYYHAGMAGFSIPAAEHSTITSWGADRENDAYRNMLEKFPRGLVAVVSDSYDYWNALQKIWSRDLSALVNAREGTLVIRPDSGDPLDLVLSSLEMLADEWGFTTNSKGYKVLHPKVRLIQGDGIDRESLTEIVDAMIGNGWSLDNVAFGMGAGLLQHVNRDTLRFAMKASAIGRTDGSWYSVQKKPKTDPSKASKAGVQHVIRMPGTEGIVTIPTEGPYTVPGDLLQTVYRMDDRSTVPMIKHWNFAEVRERAQYRGL